MAPQDFLPRADLVLFVTSSERPFSASERTFLGAIRGWRKKVLCVLNKADLLLTEAEVAKVANMDRVQTVKLEMCAFDMAATDATDEGLAKKPTKIAPACPHMPAWFSKLRDTCHQHDHLVGGRGAAARAGSISA